MGIRSILARLLKPRAPGVDDSERMFHEAAASYQAAFEELEPFTLRGFDATESSSFILDPAEFESHRSATLESQDRLAALKQAFELLIPDSPFHGDAAEMFSLACQMQEGALNSFELVARKTALAALRRQFTSRYHPGTEDPSIPLTTAKLGDVSSFAEASAEAAEEMRVDVGCWRNYAKLIADAAK